LIDLLISEINEVDAGMNGRQLGSKPITNNPQPILKENGVKEQLR